MTTYYIHGGDSSVLNAKNTKFYKYIFSKVKNKSKLLVLYHAKDRDAWIDKYTNDIDLINKIIPNNNLLFELGDSDLIKLEKQLKNSDIIFIKGGSSLKLKEALLPLKDKFRQLLSGKIIISTSAGAYLLSKYYYSNDTNSIQEGFGILPIKLFCHYSKDQQPRLFELRAYKEKLATYPIENGDFIELFSANGNSFTQTR